jgi:type I restriction enzyme M protein
VNRADLRVESLQSPVPSAGSSSALPPHWSRRPLTELCQIQAGPSYERLGIDERVVDGPVPIVMPRHLRERRVLAKDAAKTTREMAEKLAKFRLRAGDILCVRSGAQSEPALVDDGQEGWLFGTNLFRLRLFDPECADPAYLLGFLTLPAVLDWIRGRSGGSAVPFISARSLGQLMVSLPPIDEQRHIGSALLAYDEQIAAHRDFVLAAASERTTLAERLMEGALTIR